MPRPSIRAIAAGGVLLGFLILYSYTAAPGILYGDSGELQAAALTAGIPHATGYPTFVLLGGLFGRLGFASPAYCVNWMSAFFGAATGALLVVLMGELGIGVAASVAAACMFGLAFSPWRTSLRAEVYTLANAFAVLAGWRTWAAHRSGRPVDALLAGVLLGLTLTGHMIFAPLVAVLGVSLVMLVWRRDPHPIPSLLLLLGSFLLGVSPYLFLVIADVRHPAINYYDMVRIVQNPFGRPMPDFDTPWKRLGWMITGRNSYPPAPMAIQWRAMLIRPLEAGFDVFVFELGPIALLLAWLGWRRHVRLDPGSARVLALGLIASSAFAILLAGNPMLELFLLPVLLIVTFWVGSGLQVVQPMAAGRGRGVLIGAAVAAVAVVAITANALREYAEVHPFTRWKFRVVEEDPSLRAGWLPSMRSFDEPERYGRSAIERIPRGALVIAGWSELNVLRYLQAVEGRRTDLALEQTSAFSLPDRMRLWQRAHDVSRQPFVFTEWVPEMAKYYAIAETLDVIPGHRLYVQRTPIADPGR